MIAETYNYKPNGYGFTGGGKETEITLTYTVGSIDPEGNNVNIPPPPPKVLEEIKDRLYNAELVVQLSDTDRFTILHLR